MEAIGDQMVKNAPAIDDVEWVEPFDADEDPDPLFDSTRDYVTQVDRFKQHQGKPTKAKVRHAICVVCRTPFEATRSTHVSCSLRCNDTIQNAKKRKGGAS
jgi:predicted nucleic acid-binding Zn ribbon protein